jgi:hypothetical protein
MANTCESTIAVVGLKEDPEMFANDLSKAMFQIDLHNLDPKQWGGGPKVDGKTWYASLVDQYREKGSYPFTYYILFPHKPYSRLGVTVPRYRVDTKWDPPQDELKEASKVFPDPIFHMSSWVEQDGPTGEIVIRNGEVIDEICRPASWYLFDHALVYPAVGLLPSHLPFTLAQRGALRLEDAIHTIQDLRGILDNKRFTESPCQPYRDSKKVEQTRQALDGLLEQMQDAAKQLTFDGVFINDPRCKTFYDLDEKSPGGPVGDQKREVDEARTGEAKAAHEQVTASDDV